MNFLHYSNLEIGDLIVPYTKITDKYVKSLFYRHVEYHGNVIYTTLQDKFVINSKLFSYYRYAIFLKTIFTNESLLLQLYTKDHICMYSPGSLNYFYKIG